MFKRYLVWIVVLSLGLSGCLTTAVQTVQGIQSMRAGYQGYETFSMVKKIKDKTPVFKEYNVAFIDVEIQPRKGDAGQIASAIKEAYSRSITDMAKDLNMPVVCKPYDMVAVGEAQDALIIQIEEVKTGAITSFMSGENLHVRARYIDKKTAKVLTEEEHKPLKSYGHMLHTLTVSAMMKLIGPGPDEKASETEKKEWSAKIQDFFNNNSAKYPVVTAEEKKVLGEG